MLLKPCFCNLYVFSTDILKKIIIIIFLFFSVVNKSVSVNSLYVCFFVCIFFLCLKPFYLFMNHYISRYTHLCFGRTGTESI